MYIITDISLKGIPVEDHRGLADVIKNVLATGYITATIRTDAKNIVFDKDGDGVLFSSAKPNKLPLKKTDDRYKAKVKEHLNTTKLCKAQFDFVNKTLLTTLKDMGISCSVFFREFKDDPKSASVLVQGLEVIQPLRPPKTFPEQGDYHVAKV